MDINTYKDQFAALGSSEFSKKSQFLDITETSVDIKSGDKIKEESYSKTLIEACSKMPNLCKLCINSDVKRRDYKGAYVLASIVQNLNHVEELEFGAVSIDKELGSPLE